jgi:uncharacterized phiE125 gp8 family phage protein
MMRVIVAQAGLPPAALAELKQWLGVTTDGDDAQLGALLRAALDICADFTRVMPLACTCEEMVPVTMDSHVLATRPVTGLVAVFAVAADGGRTALATGAYDWLIGADGSGRLRLVAPVGAARLAVQVMAGLAAGWDTLPDAIRHGLIRLAAHQYRARDDGSDLGLPPASVVALWRPWRRMRLL